MMTRHQRPETTCYTIEVVIVDRPFSCGHKFIFQGLSLLHQLLELLFLLFNLFFCQIFHIL